MGFSHSNGSTNPYEKIRSNHSQQRKDLKHSDSFYSAGHIVKLKELTTGINFFDLIS